MNGAQLLVAALENEGVKQIFGVPGEENLDIVEALRRSTIELVVTRHEQAAAFMAATHGRLTGEAGVCLSTLGPGALNLTTGAAYAQLGALPMVMITGQKGVLSRKQARFQIVDIVSTMTPLTKMAQQIVSPATIPAIVREAFQVAQQERPGPVHLELPEDIAAEQSPAISPIPSHPIALPVANSAALDRSAGLIRDAECPLVMLGAAASRPHLAEALSDFVRRLQLPFFCTQMGKGAAAGGSRLYMGTAALSARDYVHDAIDKLNDSSFIPTAGEAGACMDWKYAFAKRSASAFAAAFAEEVTLEAAALFKPINGRENVKRVMEAACHIYESLTFTDNAADGRRQFLEWTARAFSGVKLDGVTVITRNEAGAISRIAIHHRPLGGALQFSAELGERLRGVIDPSHFLTRADVSNAGLLRRNPCAVSQQPSHSV